MSNDLKLVTNFNVEAAKFREEVEAATSLFRPDSEGKIHHTSTWLNFSGSSHINACRESDGMMETYFKVRTTVSAINQDLNNIFTILSRLEWQMEMKAKNILPDTMADHYATLDIDHFHIEIQSIFDYLCMLIGDLGYFSKDIIGKRPSFGKLRLHVSKFNEQIPNDLSELFRVVESCNWFSGYNSIRNGNIHKGGWTLVFPDKKEILFQNYMKNVKSIPEPIVMNNENIVDFKKYSVLATSRMINTLENFAEVFALRLSYDLESLKLREGLGVLRSYCPGHEVYLNWSRQLITDHIQ